jgi:hypothetical protein
VESSGYRFFLSPFAFNAMRLRVGGEQFIQEAEMGRGLKARHESLSLKLQLALDWMVSQDKGSPQRSEETCEDIWLFALDAIASESVRLATLN